VNLKSKCNLLLIDSTKPELIIAAAAGGVMTASQVCNEQRQHDKNINKMVKSVLTNAGLSFGDLSAVAVVVGDGSWTGIRVGLAAAKAYSYALNIPIIELTGQIDLAAAIDKFNKRDFANAFTARPFYNGEFIIRGESAAKKHK
jgi:tRNA threonylcarbamoyladenosine biosynthesis protein TsaB